MTVKAALGRPARVVMRHKHNHDNKLDKESRKHHRPAQKLAQPSYVHTLFHLKNFQLMFGYGLI
jgi:hypothetical protein